MKDLPDAMDDLEFWERAKVEAEQAIKRFRLGLKYELASLEMIEQHIEHHTAPDPPR